MEQAAKIASQAKPSFVQNPKSASSSQAKLWKKLALKKWQAQAKKFASQAKPQAFFHLKSKLILSALEPSSALQLTRELPMFYKHNLKHLFHQYHPLIENLRHSDQKIIRQILQKFHVK